MGQQSTSGAMAASEQHYRILFERIDEGLLIAEVLVDTQGPVDLLFLDANPAAARMTGIDYAGRRLSEIDPQAEPFWLDLWGRVALTGQGERLERYAASLDRWFSFYLFRTGDAASRRVAGIFQDITARRRQETHAEFLTEITSDLARLTAEQDIMDTVGAKTGRFFGVARCHCGDIDEDAGTCVIGHDWHREGLPSLVDGQPHRLEDYFSTDLIHGMRRGEPFILHDTLHDERVNHHNSATLGIRSAIAIPFVKDGQWRFLMSLSNPQPRAWQPDEVELLRELAARIWMRLERARAAAQLHDTQRRQAFLLQLSDRTRPLTDPQAIIATVAEAVGRYLGVAAVGYGEVAVDEDFVFVDAEYNDGRMPSGRGLHRFSDYSATFGGMLRSGETLFVEHVAAAPGAPLGGSPASQAMSMQSVAVVPLHKSGRFVAAFYAMHPEPRVWTGHDRALLPEVAERTWAALELARAEAASRRAEQQYRELFTSIDEGFGICQIAFDGQVPADFRWLDVNPRFLQLTGLPLTDVIQAGSQRALLPGLEDGWSDTFGQVARTGIATRYEVEMPTLGCWFDVSAFQTGAPHERKVAVLMRDITGSKHAADRLRHASLHDPLTGLPNRAMLLEYASHLLPQHVRSGRTAAVLFVDLDRFKSINDTCGHHTGDQVLVQVAARLASGLRAEDVVVRFGGDEFIVLLQDIGAPSGAAEVARHLVDRISEPYQVGDVAPSLSCSVGIALFPRDGQDIDTLVSQADMAMYQAKQAGRHGFQFYHPEHTAAARWQSAIEQQLKHAVSAGAFHLCYQPVVHTGSGQVVSVEALLRLNGTDVGPDHFVPIAEATGLINPIGRWLLREASRQHRKWIAAGLPPIPVAVNISAVEFRDADFADRFRRTLLEEDLDPQALQLEVTETAVMGDIDHAIAVLSDLKALGVKILLDDFGTGHSSLAYLARLPLNKLKIDRSFVSPPREDPAGRAITTAMIALGQTLNLEVVAEGVESERVLRYVLEQGCEQVQGYHVGRPMSGDEFLRWFQARGYQRELFSGDFPQ